MSHWLEKFSVCTKAPAGIRIDVVVCRGERVRTVVRKTAVIKPKEVASGDVQLSTMQNVSHLVKAARVVMAYGARRCTPPVVLSPVSSFERKIKRYGAGEWDPAPTPRCFSFPTTAVIKRADEGAEDQELEPPHSGEQETLTIAARYATL